MTGVVWQGDRVRLVLPTLADESEFIAAAIASKNLHSPWVIAPDNPKTFSAHIDHFAKEDQYGFLVRANSNNALVGVVDIGDAVYRALCSAYLGYFVFAGFERQGLMAEAVTGAVDLAFSKLRLHRLEANIQPDNHASRALIESVGFRLEGFSPRYLRVGEEWQDHERWAMTVEEWDG
jgi:ribosomal-protein-alanine N-acetyltransferase